MANDNEPKVALSRIRYEPPVFQGPDHTLVMSGCGGCAGGCGGFKKVKNNDKFFDGKVWQSNKTGKCDDCTDCKCADSTPSCMDCKHVNLMSGICTKGEEKPTKECFEKA